ncbi:hypothetical protein Cni_G01271 [Canna indica]|uniref:Sugar phosphate transporter domain-containing protein n=1 Tax=Canna indica TaxID=4628 RepID=A0AAQ3PXZ3_9LILI|nr:hypothetical protein Cni_G01271 [Canna indica]
MIAEDTTCGRLGDVMLAFERMQVAGAGPGGFGAGNGEVAGASKHKGACQGDGEGMKRGTEVARALAVSPWSPWTDHGDAIGRNASTAYCLRQQRVDKGYVSSRMSKAKQERQWRGGGEAAEEEAGVDEGEGNSRETESSNRWLHVSSLFFLCFLCFVDHGAERERKRERERRQRHEMQSAAAISAFPSPSSPRLLQIPRRKSLGPPARSLWPVAAGPFSVTSLRIHGLHRHGSGSSWVCVPSVPLDRDETMRSSAKRDLAAKVSSVPDSTAGDGSPDKVDSAGEGSLLQTLLLGSLFGLWYIFNIYFNVYNKQARPLPFLPLLFPGVLKVFQFPLTITLLQFAIGTVVVLFMWTTNLYKRPKISSFQVSGCDPNLECCDILTNGLIMYISARALFNVCIPPFFQIAAILPLAIVHTMGNLFTNMSLGKVAISFTHTIKAMEPFFLSSPICLVLRRGIKITPSYLQSAGLNLKQIYVRSLLAGLCFHAYQQVSYMILARVSPVTHSVGNCVKRVVVIVTSVLFFRTPVSPVNALEKNYASRSRAEVIVMMKAPFLLPVTIHQQL